MVKYNVYSENVEIKYKDRAEIKEACVLNCQADHEPVIEKSFYDLEGAIDFLNTKKSEIVKLGNYYVVTEYYVEETEYKYDEITEEYEPIYETIEILQFSKMEIEVVERETFEVLATFDNLEKAEEFIEYSEKECYLNF